MSPLDLVLGVLALAMLAAIVRLIIGPTDADRAAAVDFGFFVFIAAVAVLAARLRTAALLDIVLTATLVGFLATVALARLVERRSR
ncbi:monovalent cation/H+ antiporter complex subunit F [Solwaraspora sp. WMMD406]|uniref:monovalent cation/H+ antiporter complex subunit F n=1 Tax=Solwaraspora sp. WMMD406 TaxID=3016095 RepID=UPI0024159EA4|nr:monovalent cation/H+ antiporter complex subunit F [Solwaraspora sp. WMMD406]MDG4765325.1 monovalent cation/H+ antiporter complex subunit F [Solwaraspora sp. WMMD406]